MKTRIRVVCVLVIVLGLMLAEMPAQGGSGQQPASVQGAGVVSQNAQDSQAISQTTLLPVFAVEMNFDPSWIDSADVPTKSANYGHNGVNDKFQSAWDLLKPAGFDAIRFTLDLQDSHSAARLANLCIWARANTVTLIPVLQNTSGGAGVAFLTGLVSQLRAGDGKNFVAYTQIAYFQVEKSFNIGSVPAKSSPAESQKALLSSVDALRASELQALRGTGVQPTPIMAGVSFDYELVAQGAIVGVPLDQATEQKAQAALKKVLEPIVANANVDVLNVAWFPRSISSGDEGHFAGLLREVENAAPGKQVILTTGFSTAFNSVDQQNQFLTITLTNMWDFRLSTGSSSPFQGVIFAQALQGSSANLPAPGGSSDPSQWNWNDKAKQLAEMWSGGKVADDLNWWLAKIESNRGLLSAPSDAAAFVSLPGLQTLQQVSTTFTQAARNVTIPASGTAGNLTTAGTNVSGSSGGTATSNPSATTTNLVPALLSADPASTANTTTSLMTVPQPSGAPASASLPTQQILSMLMQQVLPQITTALLTRLASHPGGGTQGQYASSPASNSGSGVGAATSNYASNYNTSPTVPSSSTASSFTSSTPGTYAAPVSAGMVSLSSQDVTVDVASVNPGQTVHITAQIHNGNANQDASGLSVQLIDPSNPSSSSQNMQTGVFVPRLGATPVQLSWIASQTSGNPAQLSIQVLDATGAQLAAAQVPTISIGGAGATNLGFSATSAAGSSPSSLPPGGSLGNSTAGNSLTNSLNGGTAFATTPSTNVSGASTGTTSVPSTSSTGGPPATSANSTPALQTSTGGPAISGGTAGGPQPTGVSPRIAYFGSLEVPGQGSTFLVQVVNPSSAPMSSVQAQIYVGGTAGQIVQIGAMLPQQSRSVVFDQSALNVGGQTVPTVKVVITADGSAPATATVSASPPKPASGRSLVPANRLAVRAITPTTSGTSHIGNSAPGNRGSNIASPATAAISQPVTQPTAQGSNAASPAGAAQSLGTLTSTQPTASATPAAAVLSSQTTGAGSTPSTGTPGQTPAAPRVRAPRTNQPTGNAPASTATVGAQGTNASSSTQMPRTVLPTAGPTTTAGTIQPNPSVTPIQANAAGQTSSVSVPAPVARTIQPPGTARSNPAIPTIQPGSGATSTGSATQTQAARTIQPPGAPGAILPNRASSANGGQAYLDLSVSPADIRVSPGSQAGQVQFTVLVRNLGNLATSKATVVFRLTVGSRQVGVSNPITFSIPASGTYQATWTTPLSPGQNAQQVVVSVNAAGDVNSANNQAALNLAAPR